MNKEKIQKWINGSKPNESIIYHIGHLAEERDNLEIREKANTFMLAAQQRKIDLFQNKVKKGDENHRPIYEYIAKKLKNERNKYKN
tara:strand:+ start:36 stop:293 length:258 start_codon:yes stop_codon:yes gene_type:complete